MNGGFGYGAPHHNIPFRPAQRTYSTPVTPAAPPSPYAVHSPYHHGRPSSSGSESVHHRQAFRNLRSNSYSHVTPLEDFRLRRRWPPLGHTPGSVLTQREAQDIVASGASTFKGYWDEIRNAPGHHRFFVVMESEHYRRTDAAVFQCDAFKDMSLSITGSSDSAFPWLALEQPAMLFAYGRLPGTTTLTFRVGRFGSLRPTLNTNSGIKPRPMKLASILGRLQKLEVGLNEEDTDALYTDLYGSLLIDPEADTDPHYGLERQIADLIIVLGDGDWIDFSKPRNHVVAKFFDSQDLDRKKHFFYQLLLSVELYLRIHAEQHHESAKRQLLLGLPPKIGWDMAVAQRWLENMSIARSRDHSTGKGKTFSFELRSKRRQVDALRRFAEILKWPNMEELNDILDEVDPEEKRVEDRSADAMSWFTGIVMPGPTLPWVLMNSLIDCDEGTGESLNFLTHMKPSSGFQYRANTYWSAQCVVGKVLGAARGVNQVAGWIGPCSYSPDLKRTECAIIRQRPPLDARLLNTDIDTMAQRTLPLGPDAIEYPVADYDILIPEMDEVADVIRVEKLCFEPIREQKTGTGGPLTFEASIIFAFSRYSEPSVSYPLSLRHDVDFVSAFPCHSGPHVLFWDYAYRCVKVDDGLTDIKDWASRNQQKSKRHSAEASGDREQHDGRASSPTNTSYLSRDDDEDAENDGAGAEAETMALAARPRPAFEGLEEVLAIEALGVSDNEVFARAWCAHWGVSAVVARVGETCMACAIREAYAACLSVVILTEARRATDDER